MKAAPPPPELLARRRTLTLRDDPRASARDFAQACGRFQDEVAASGLYEVGGVRRGLHSLWDAFEIGEARVTAFDATAGGRGHRPRLRGRRHFRRRFRARFGFSPAELRPVRRAG